MSEGRRHFRAFDGVRALAILPVLWHHATPRLLPGVLGKGAVGVDLFFALSGFLITSLLLFEKRRRESTDPAAPPIDLPDFHHRRLSRLVPLYVVVLFVHALALTLSKPDAPQTAHYLRSLPAHLSFTSNWFVDFDVPHPVTMAVTWSLAVEMQFYALWSFALRWVRPRVALGGIVLGLGLLDFAFEHRLLGETLPRGSVAFRVLTSLSLPILLGALGALVDEWCLFSERRCALLRRVVGHPTVPLLCLAGAVVCLLQRYTPYIPLSLCLATFVWSAATNDGGLLAPLLTARPVAHLGRASYAIYLTHLGPLAAVRTLVPSTRENPMLLFALTLPLAWVLGEACRRVVEVPARDWLRKRETER